MKLIKKGIEHLTGDGLDFRDRQFILLTVMVQLAIMCVFVADIILGENNVEIIDRADAMAHATGSIEPSRDKLLDIQKMKFTEENFQITNDLFKGN